MSLSPSIGPKESVDSGNGNENEHDHEKNVGDIETRPTSRSSNQYSHFGSSLIDESNSGGSSVQHTHAISSSSLDVAGPLNLKSTPADPHLSDVHSISSGTSIGNNTTALGSVSDIIERDNIERKHEKELHIQMNNNAPSGETEDGNDTLNGSINGNVNGINNSDVNSHGSAYGNVHGNINSNANGNGNRNFLDNMMSSLSFRSASNPSPSLQMQIANRQHEEISSPSIISHRRQKNGKGVTSPVPGLNSPNSPNFPSEGEKSKETPGKTQLEEFNEYDTSRFVDETYLDTPFHYAVPVRDAEFHRLFKALPQGDRLLDDFSCALSREFLYQGRLYICEGHLCFYSSLLGWIAKVVIPFKDVTFMEKTSTAGLFQNAISIETKTGKTQFNGFISRDIAFTLLKEVWARTLLAEGEKEKSKDKTSSTSSNVSQKRESSLDSNSLSVRKGSDAPSNRSYVSENDAVIEDAIMSVDDVTPTQSEIELDEGSQKAKEGDDKDSNDHTSDNLSESKSSSASNRDRSANETRCYKFKPNIGYHYTGPLCDGPTKYKYSPEVNNEFVLAEVEIKAPPGVVFELIFGKNPSFWIDFFKSQDSSKFTDLGEFDKVSEQGYKYREFSYAKGLHFPVGPKSTKCVVSEHILECDYSEFIHVLNITRTPDVPSGGSFSTRTRYMLRWATKTTTMLKVSYFMDWTTSSWIKSMVESGARTGQISATKDLIRLIYNYVDTYVTVSTINVSMSSNKIDEKSVKQVSRSVSPSSVVTAKRTKTLKPAPEVQELKEIMTLNISRFDAFRISAQYLFIVAIISLVLLLYNDIKLRGEIKELRALLIQSSLAQNRFQDSIKDQILSNQGDVSNF